MRGWPSFSVGGRLGYSGPSLVYDIEFGVCQNQMNYSRRQLSYDKETMVSHLCFLPGKG